MSLGNGSAPAPAPTVEQRLDALEDEVLGGRKGNALRWHIAQIDRAIAQVERRLRNEQHARRLRWALEDEQTAEWRSWVSATLRDVHTRSVLYGLALLLNVALTAAVLLRGCG